MSELVLGSVGSEILWLNIGSTKVYGEKKKSISHLVTTENLRTLRARSLLWISSGPERGPPVNVEKFVLTD